jgi:multiple sugar transport system substrate-binding protein
MYDPLYSAFKAFTRDTGLDVEIVVRLPHPELNAWVARTFEAGDPDVDLLSTHTKYAPSQAQWLSPLDGLLAGGELADFLERPLSLSRIEGRLLQVPRNIDVRLLHYRTDLLNAARASGSSSSGVPAVPETWNELADAAAALTRGSMFGFVFPGRDSGLFGTFYELLTGAGGELFDGSLRPAFDSPAGEWAMSFLAELYQERRVAPRELPSWHYDEVSAAFRAGTAAMVCDWPGSYHLYREAETSLVADRLGLALLPAGPAGVRAAYGGCHSFAVPRAARNPEGGVALLKYLTSFDAQLGEARCGAIPCRVSALASVRGEASHSSRDSERWQLLAETEKSMIIPPRFAAYPQCEDAIWHAAQRAMVGEWPPERAVAAAAADVRAIVDATDRLTGTR